MNFFKRLACIGVSTAVIIWMAGLNIYSMPQMAPSAFAAETVACSSLGAGDMIKIVGKPAIYVLNDKIQYLYFPTGDEFKSWNADNKYSGYYKSIDQACFDSLSIPTSFPYGVNFRPGSYVIKKKYSSQLYVVLPNNTKAKITDSAAKALYGSKYKIMEVSELFWQNYTNNSADITGSSPEPHNGMIVSVDNKIYYVNECKQLREISSSAFITNRYKQEFVRSLPSSRVSGFAKVQTNISGKISALSNRTQLASESTCITIKNGVEEEPGGQTGPGGELYLTLTKDNGFPDGDLSVPASDTLLGKFNIINDTASEITLSKVKLDFAFIDEFGASDLSNVYVKYGSNKTSTKTTVSLSNYWNISKVFSPQTSMSVEVRGNVSAKATGTNQNADQIVSQLEFEGTVADKTYYSGKNGSNAFVDGQLLTAKGANTPPPVLDEACDNGIDDDKDGKIDCADSDCTSQPVCQAKPTPEVCDDKLDNDMDEKIDCADSDCSADPACQTVTPEICDDQIDNDKDGKTDCADPDCSAQGMCQYETICDDGIDNDNNGKIDCLDSACSVEPICAQQPTTETNCTDGIDNDGDGLIDCNDSDCSAEPTCQSQTVGTLAMSIRQNTSAGEDILLTGQSSDVLAFYVEAQNEDIYIDNLVVTTINMTDWPVSEIKLLDYNTREVFGTASVGTYDPFFGSYPISWTLPTGGAGSLKITKNQSRVMVINTTFDLNASGKIFSIDSIQITRGTGVTSNQTISGPTAGTLGECSIKIADTKPIISLASHPTSQLSGGSDKNIFRYKIEAKNNPDNPNIDILYLKSLDVNLNKLPSEITVNNLKMCIDSTNGGQSPSCLSGSVANCIPLSSSNWECDYQSQNSIITEGMTMTLMITGDIGLRNGTANLTTKILSVGTFDNPGDLKWTDNTSDFTWIPKVASVPSQYLSGSGNGYLLDTTGPEYARVTLTNNNIIGVVGAGDQIEIAFDGLVVPRSINSNLVHNSGFINAGVSEVGGVRICHDPFLGVIGWEINGVIKYVNNGITTCKDYSSKYSIRTEDAQGDLLSVLTVELTDNGTTRGTSMRNEPIIVKDPNDNVANNAYTAFPKTGVF
ncbi:MAG: hypothetical protein ABH832_02220 [bacterium]